MDAVRPVVSDFELDPEMRWLINKCCFPVESARSHAPSRGTEHGLNVVASTMRHLLTVTRR